MTRTGDWLWEPSKARREQSLLSQFAQEYRPQASSYAELHSWSVRDPAAFWSALWQFAQIKGALEGPVIQGQGMPGTRFFPQARLNVARNLLERGHPDDLAVIFRSEDGRKQVWTREQLKFAAAGISRVLKKAGVEPGDRVAAVLPNRPETVAAMLATTAMGAVWSSCSPDFGDAALLDRFGQIAPKVLLTVSDYRYGGKLHDCRKRVGNLLRALPSLQAVYCLTDDLDLPTHKKIHEWPQPDPIAGLPYRELPFDHPLFILYSSGTTGAPKAILHGAGGTLLQLVKEHQLHCDIHPGERLFYYTTCGWMMWNWLVMGLASEAAIMLYEGSPFTPDGNALFDFAQSARCNFFG
ncbi:MAG: AMP-binding protein, partial [Oceanococcaceae bacterium]